MSEVGSGKERERDGERSILHLVRGGALIPGGGCRAGDRVVYVDVSAEADAPAWWELDPGSGARVSAEPIPAEQMIDLLFDSDAVIVW